jgi:ELWxxDGT repeat protein
MGTQLLVDIVAGPDGSNPSFGAMLGTRRAVFRAAGRPTDDDEPWVTDGTVAGTYQFGNINPGNSRSNPIDFVVLNGKLLFKADEYLKGEELYVWEDIGAVAKPVGKSSGTPASGYPTFEVTDPVLGGFIEFRGEEAPAGSVGFIYYGLPFAGEFVEPTFEVHTIYNVAPIFLFNVMPAPDGSYSLTIPMPNIPGLAGLPIGFQNYFGPTAAPFTVASTNAVYSQFGY